MIAPIYLLVTAGAFYINLGLAVYAFVNRHRRGAIPLGWMLLALSQLAIMFFLMTITPTPELAFIWVRLRFIGVTAIPVFLFLFVLEYTERAQWRARWLVPLLFVVPLITQGVLWVRPESFFGTWELVRYEWYSLEAHTFTGWFDIHNTYSLLLSLLSMGLLIEHVWRVAPYKRMPGMLIVSTLFTGYGLSLAPSFFGPPPGFRVTPIGLMLVGLALFWATFRYQLLELMPLASRKVLDHLEAYVIVVDVQDRILYINPSLKQHVSQHIDHPIGHPLENVFPIWQQNIQEVRHKQNLHIQFASDRTGEERIYDLTIKPLFNRARRYIGRVFVSWDITEQVNVQIEKHRAELLRSFIENTHHEFRTGLTSIANSAYLIRRGSRVEERIDIIGETVQEMTNMVDKMLELVAIDHTQFLKFEAVDINKLVRGMIETFHTAYERKGQTIHIQESHNLPTVQGDIDKLNAALCKIVHNAIRFTPEGGTIQIETRQKANTVIVQIADSGIGMDELTQQRLFERFYRADTAHSTRGFGLGLPIAKHIIDAHGGQIIVNSTLGQGSTFKVVLPIESPISDGSNNRAAPARTESQSGYDHP